jgi:hypothetical protein
MDYIKVLRQAVGNMPLIICAAGVIVTDSNKIRLMKEVMMATGEYLEVI